MIIFLKTGYQIFKSSKTQKCKNIIYRDEFEIDYKKMIVIQKKDHKETRIQRGNTNKIEINLEEMCLYFIPSKFNYHCAIFHQKIDDSLNDYWIWY